jgi:hypothetical protein
MKDKTDKYSLDILIQGLIVGALFIGLSGALLTWLLMGKLKPSVVPSILEIKSITV